jgi:hypothetical protein
VVDVVVERHGVAREERAYGDTWVDVDATTPVTLVRSMAYLPGWRATALNTTTGKSEALKVTRDGLIQQVTCPSGRVADPLPLPRAVHRGESRRVDRRASS